LCKYGSAGACAALHRLFEESEEMLLIIRVRPVEKLLSNHPIPVRLLCDPVVTYREIVGRRHGANVSIGSEIADRLEAEIARGILLIERIGWRIEHDSARATSPSNIFRARQYVLTDLHNGRSRPLIDAPYGDVLAYIESFQAAWSPSSRRLLLTNTFLPLDPADQVERAKRLRPCAVTSVDMGKMTGMKMDGQSNSASPQPK
jgi:hypothetical protein